MAYVGGSIVSLFGERPQAATALAARRMAEKGGDRMVELTVANTPIGGRYDFGNEGGGNLRSSWYRLRVERVSYGGLGTGYRSGVASDVDYAPHVEHGTGLWGPFARKFLIEAKPGHYLRWIDRKTGEEVFAKRVWHPGSPGQHMVAIAASVTEHEADEGGLMDGILDDWARAVEGAAD